MIDYFALVLPTVLVVVALALRWYMIQMEKKKPKPLFVASKKIDWWDATNDPKTWSSAAVSAHKKQLENQVFFGGGVHMKPYPSAVSVSVSSYNYTQIYAQGASLKPPKITREQAVAMNNGTWQA